MINMGQHFIDLMRRDTQQVSARLNILDSPNVTDYGFSSNSIDSYLLDNGYFIEKEGNPGVYWIKQINNCITNENGIYGVFEDTGIKLDGSVKILSENGTDNELGWYSASLCGSDKIFSTYPYLEWNHLILQQSKFNIVFSKIRNEYSTEFDIIFTALQEDPMDDPIVTTINVTNNTSIVYTVNTPPLLQYGGTVKILIKKWSVANARAKIIDLYYGDMLIYTDEEIVSINSNKEVDLINESINSKEINFIVQDINGDYNIFNPQGGLANLNKNSRVALELGPVDDFEDSLFCKIDEYVLGTPKKEKNSLEVSLTGYGRLNTFNNETFRMNNYEKATAKVILEGYNYYTDNSHMTVDNIIESEALEIRTQYPKDISKIDGIRKIATAVRGNIIETVDNNILIKRIEENTPVSYISLDNILNNPEISKIDKPRTINISIYYPTTTGVIEVFRQEYTEELNNGQYYNLFYNTDHTAGPYTAYLKLTQSGVEGEFFPIFIDYKAIFIPNQQVPACTIRINANKVEIQSTNVEYNINTSNIDVMNINNESLETYTMSDAVFYWILDNMNKEFEYKFEVQDICTYELGDTITIESNIFINGNQVIRNAIITGIDFDYAGSLHYNITARGY